MQAQVEVQEIEKISFFLRFHLQLGFQCPHILALALAFALVFAICVTCVNRLI